MKDKFGIELNNGDYIAYPSMTYTEILVGKIFKICPKLFRFKYIKKHWNGRIYEFILEERTAALPHEAIIINNIISEEYRMQFINAGGK